MELPALLAGSGMKRASSDEVGAGYCPHFSVPRPPLAARRSACPPQRGGFLYALQVVLSNQILLAYVVGIGSLLC